MSLQDLSDLTKLLEGLRTELDDPVWQSDQSGARATLVQSRNLYANLVSSLAGENESPAEWELFFVPPDQAADNTIISVFRKVQVTIGSNQSSWQDISLTSTPLSLGKGSVDKPLRIAFRKLIEDVNSETTPVKPLAWGLPGLIRDRKPERLENGLIWRFRIPLQDAQQNLTGNVTFEARLLDPKRPLPKLETGWPP
jgi:hypothetical protein